MKPIVTVFLASWVIFITAVLSCSAFQKSNRINPDPTQSTEPASKLPAVTPPVEKKEHIFRGTVEKIDTGTGLITVSGENVPGWMAAMTMNYRVAKAAISIIKVGDYITAKVYDGDFITLHDVRVVVKSSAVNELPPLAYVCDTRGQDIAIAAAEANVIEDEPGKCPQAGAPLMPIRLVTVYSCLKFQSFVQDSPGVCPVDKSELVPVTVSLYFTCKDNPAVHELEPRKCADGSASMKNYERRPHGDHNPRHGGQFFMADDSWHHLEGTFVRPNIFRVYFYNDMTQPLPSAGFSARVIKTDAKGNQIGAPVVLKRGKNNILEAPVPGTPLPAIFEMRLKFKDNDKEHMFDFTFTEYSKEPGPDLSTSSMTSTTASTQSKADRIVPPVEPLSQPGFPRQNAPAVSQSGTSVMVDSVLYPTSVSSTIKAEEPIPATAPQLLDELAKEAQLVKMLLDQGNLGGLWVPALRAKDLSIGLADNHLNELPETQRPKLVSAVKELTLAAWQIDAAGDLGNRELVLPLYNDFSQAIEDIQATYEIH